MEKKKKNFKSSWSFSIYNVYNRQNPYFIYFDGNDDNFGLTAKQVSLFQLYHQYHGILNFNYEKIFLFISSY